MDTRKNIKATNMELTQEVSDYLDKRLQSVEKLIDKNDTSAIFEIEIEKIVSHQTGDVFRAEINLSIAGGHLRAEAKEETILNAIDKARSDVLMELRKTKGKRLRLLRRGGTAIKGFMHSVGSGGGRLRDFAKRRRR
jgi:ribosomal subunit interface protein